jgi:hypothetical protein
MAAFSEMLYGVESNTDGLSIYDPVTGDVNFIGPLHPDLNRFVTPIAMAVQPSDGTIYVWNNSDIDPCTGSIISTGVLLTVDPATGLATEVGPTPPQGAGLAALAFTPDGRLYGLDNVLVEIDPNTGEFLTEPVSLGLRIGGADSDASGMIWGVELTLDVNDQLVYINPNTGTVSHLSTLSPAVGTIGSIVFDPAGNLIGSAFHGPLGDVLFDIDPNTGTVSNTRSTKATQGMGFVPAYDEEETEVGEDVTVRLYDRRKKAKKKAVRVKFKKVTKKGTTTYKKKKAKKKAKKKVAYFPPQFAVCTPSNVIEIETTAEFEPPVEVCVDYSDISCSGSDLRLLHRTEDGAWEDTTTCADEPEDLTTCGDADTLDVCGEVDSLSDFAVLLDLTVDVKVDIKPGSCPNPLNVKSSGVLPVAILGSEDLDVGDIDPASIFLGGARAIRSSHEDVAAPASEGTPDEGECDCTTEGPDGKTDLTLKFNTQDIVQLLGDVNHGDLRLLTLTGALYDGTPIEGSDCIVVRGRFKSLEGADINKDGVVNMVDLAKIAKKWLQSNSGED